MDFLDEDDQVDDFSYLDYGNTHNNSRRPADSSSNKNEALQANTQSSEYRFSDFTAPSQVEKSVDGKTSGNAGLVSGLDDLSLASLSLSSQLTNSSSDVGTRPIAFEDLEDEELPGIDEDEILPEHACK